MPRLWAGFLSVVLGLGLLMAVEQPPRADGATRAGPVAELHIHGQAYEGQRDAILASLSGRCAPGYEFADLVLDFAQGDVVTPSTLGAPFPCDGRWHTQRVSSLEGAFEPGRATLTGRLSVIHRVTGDPGPQAVDVRSIYVRPAAKVVVPRTARLGADGVIRLVVLARCDAPWVLSDFYISANQGEFPTIGSDDALLDLICDGVTRPVTVWLSSSPVAFHRGLLRVDAEISLLDPEQFDPVTQARTTRMVAVR